MINVKRDRLQYIYEQNQANMKKTVSLLLAMVLLLGVIPAVAHDKTEHNEELEYVLFGDQCQ